MTAVAEDSEKQAKKSALSMLLARRPSKKELEEKNILPNEENGTNKPLTFSGIKLLVSNSS